MEALLDGLLQLESRAEAAAFLRDLCTLNELRDLAQRWAVVRLLDAGLHYSEISRRTGASTATITRIASWLNHGEGGYRLLLERARRAAEGPGSPGRADAGPAASPGGSARGRADPPSGDAPMTASPRSPDARCRSTRPDGVARRMTLAVPNKGRLVEPTLALLHDAGLVFEERDRSLVSRVENVALDILFVRTNDVIEFVGDGVADLGITGGDLLAEAGTSLPVVRSLGYGRCRLAAAVPRDAPQREIADLAGLRVATAHPGATARWFDGSRDPRRRDPALRRRGGGAAAGACRRASSTSCPPG